jgi:hypothetical protein
MTNLRPNPKEITRTINLLFRPGDVFELRAPSAGRQQTISGYFDNAADLVKAVTGLNGAAPATYLSLNPVDPKLLARAKNRVKPYAKVTTSDKDIVERRWLLVDVDASRPPGISSTDEEHAAAIALAREIAWFLAEEFGFPAPVEADSGNGGHLLFRIDMPNNEASTALLERVLKALASRFNNAVVTIDQSVFNPARITKLYGSPAQKGDSTTERPWRMSQLLRIPENLQTVPREKLEALAASADPPPRDSAQSSRETFDLEGWIRRHHLAVRPPEPYKGGRKWIFEECPFDRNHRASSAAIFEVDGRPGFRCLHASCKNKSWRQLRELIEGVAHSSARSGASEQERRKEQFQLVVRTAGEIYDGDYPEPAAIVEAILYSGLTLLAGRAKVGKSWLGIDLALSLVQGSKFAGFLDVPKPSSVLYVSLEERPRQTRARLRQLTSQGDFLASLRFIHELPPLMAGGAAVLDAELAEHPAEVVIVDSLLGITKAAGRKNMDALQTDYNIVNTLREVAERHRAALVLIAHTRKAAGDYFVDLVQGTTGVTAAADAVWVLQKKSDGTAVLNVTGREVEDRIYGLTRRGALWHIEGEGEEFTQTEERREILELLRENERAMKPMAIARALQKRVPAVQKLLGKLVNDGLVTRLKYGQYQLLAGAKV